MDDLRAAPSMLGVCAAFLPAESAAFLPAAHRPPRPGRRLACSPIHNRREHIKMRAPRRGRLDDPPPDSWLITGPDRGGVVAARPPIDGYDTRQATNIEAGKESMKAMYGPAGVPIVPLCTIACDPKEASG